MKIKIPNYLTIGRIIIVPIFVFTFYLPGFYGDLLPFALFIIASFTDFLDGLLARMFKEESKLGELLDPIADKIIVATALILLVMNETIKNYEVIAAIRKVKPKKLFIACDGPRKGNKKESDKVQKTIAICKEQINWDCEVKWLISKKNLGCKVGVNKAINWFFEHVKEGIIMVDDNLAHPDFFVFCQKLLQKYRFDKRVWCISGTNNQDGIIRGDASYYFGKTYLCWGWATWKDRWAEYDMDMNCLLYTSPSPRDS